MAGIVGVIIGSMFVFSGVQQFVLAAVVDSMRWLWIVFGVLFIAAGIVCFVNPEATFVGFADILGFLFLMVGVWWTIHAFVGLRNLRDRDGHSSLMLREASAIRSAT